MAAAISRLKILLNRAQGSAKSAHRIMSLQLLKFLSTPQGSIFTTKKSVPRKKYICIVETATSHSKAKIKKYNSKKFVVFHLSQLDLK